MNFTEMNRRDAIYFGYVNEQVETVVSLTVWIQVDRAISVPIWEQVWQNFGMKIHEEINYGKRMLRER